MSIDLPFHDARYMTVVRGGLVTAVLPPPWRQDAWPESGMIPEPWPLLRVVLDDQLFLDLGVDLRPDGQRVHQDAHLVRHHLEPGGHDALAGLGPRDHERRQLEG